MELTYLAIVTQAPEKFSLLNNYNDVVGKAAGLGLIKKQDANIQQYFTGNSLDSLYIVISEEEKRIRRDPAGSRSAILEKVMGR